MMTSERPLSKSTQKTYRQIDRMTPEELKVFRKKQAANQAKYRASRTGEKREQYLNIQRKRVKEGWDRAALGGCRLGKDCGPAVGTSHRCMWHWLASFRTILRRVKGSSFKEQDIPLLLWPIWMRQGGKCAITGLPLTPGLSASVDHIIPIKKGGTNKEDNLRFVHINVNLMKGTLLDGEFKLLLATVGPALMTWASHAN